MRKEDYETAEKYLVYFSEQNPERKRKQALIYSKTNRMNEAYKAYEELLFSGYQMTSMVFNSMHALAMEHNNLAVGTKIHLKGGEYITLAEDGFDLSGRKVEERYFLENSDIRDCFNFLLNHTSGTRSSLFRTECYDKWLELIPDVLDLIGVDASKAFTLNGMKFTRDEDGNIVSQKMIDAQIAFEQQVARNLTYRHGDKMTIQTIAYRTDYYFRIAPDNVKQAWAETLEETNLNPFATTYGSTIAQIAMEQDFATGGNNQLFGESVENSIESVKKIINRIDNPLGVIPKDNNWYQKDKDFAEKERQFYTTFLSKLENMLQ